MFGFGLFIFKFKYPFGLFVTILYLKLAKILSFPETYESNVNVLLLHLFGKHNSKLLNHPYCDGAT